MTVVQVFLLAFTCASGLPIEKELEAGGLQQAGSIDDHELIAMGKIVEGEDKLLQGLEKKKGSLERIFGLFEYKETWDYRCRDFGEYAGCCNDGEPVRESKCAEAKDMENMKKAIKEILPGLSVRLQRKKDADLEKTGWSQHGWKRGNELVCELKYNDKFVTKMSGGWVYHLQSDGTFVKNSAYSNNAKVEEWIGDSTKWQGTYWLVPHKLKFVQHKNSQGKSIPVYHAVRQDKKRRESECLDQGGCWFGISSDGGNCHYLQPARHPRDPETDIVKCSGPCKPIQRGRVFKCSDQLAPCKDLQDVEKAAALYFKSGFNRKVTPSGLSFFTGCQENWSLEPTAIKEMTLPDPNLAIGGFYSHPGEKGNVPEKADQFKHIGMTLFCEHRRLGANLWKTADHE